ncbi:MAG: DUF302 domain-containing protein [Flavobacteriales bacterium]|nr:DUF302 domain-containing protein [Flavobacteriales bacterium]
MKKFLYTLLLASIVISCKHEVKEKLPNSSILEKLDRAHLKVEKSSIQYREVVQLDHHQMAEVYGVYTPPAIVSLFSNDTIVSNLIKIDQLIGLDMPFKVLAYSEPDTLKLSYAYTSAKFIQKRHHLSDIDIVEYGRAIDGIVVQLPQKLISHTPVSSVDSGFGIVRVLSNFDYDVTLLKIRAMVK